MAYSPVLQQMLDALRCLPGVGARTAQRMAFHLLERDRDGAQELVDALAAGLQQIGKCERCRMLAEAELCWVCASTERDHTLICAVESPADVIAIEDSGIYRGRYFVLQGRLSPLDGVGPEQLGIALLADQLRENDVSELILATSSTVEGEATASYLASIAQESGLKVSRIAYGVPIGGELEYVDASTLSRAIAGRSEVSPG
jgi:recombination protein RecR